ITSSGCFGSPPSSALTMPARRSNDSLRLIGAVATQIVDGNWSDIALTSDQGRGRWLPRAARPLRRPPAPELAVGGPPRSSTPIGRGYRPTPSSPQPTPAPAWAPLPLTAVLPASEVATATSPKSSPPLLARLRTARRSGRCPSKP